MRHRRLRLQTLVPPAVRAAQTAGRLRARRRRPHGTGQAGGRYGVGKGNGGTGRGVASCDTVFGEGGGRASVSGMAIQCRMSGTLISCCQHISLCGVG